MHRPWTNPSPESRELLGLDNDADDLSGEDDDCFPDRIVYHDEQHLANVLRLYNRPEEGKNLGVSEFHTNKTGDLYLGHQSDCVMPIHPSAQEVAVWNALEEELGATNCDSGRLNNLDNLGYGMTQDLNLNDILEREVRTVNALPVYQSMELMNTAKEMHKLKDAWDHTEINGGPLDVEHLFSPHLAKTKLHQMAKQRKETQKKKASFSFGTVKNMRLQGNIKLKGDQKLSLTDRLLNLETTDEPCNATGTSWNGAKNSIPSVNMPITNKLFELVQQDAQSKAYKVKNTTFKNDRGILKMNVMAKSITARGDTVNQQDGKVYDLIKLNNESIHKKLQKALLEAPPPVRMEHINAPAREQGSVFGFTGKLQKVLDCQRNNRAAFSKMLQTNDSIEYANCMELKIVSKSLEACFAACLCDILKLPQASDGEQTTVKLTAIFNLQTNADLELESGNIVRIYPPWQQLGTTILCSYFCQNVARTSP